ncbi:hypothetical protein LGQ02_15130 [Bacillus shivajii]|uniref:hypothetical protein n=1 Tax=Bacillus shivajii TaxID=1983719 RepID=UPI001CF98118|nr:hypothetical protein [Bacillus shivajii]UCZ52168.1 hypothetical protein LGQ02_15130 [Bacillus shivajii]
MISKRNQLFIIIGLFVTGLFIINYFHDDEEQIQSIIFESFDQVSQFHIEHVDEQRAFVIYDTYDESEGYSFFEKSWGKWENVDRFRPVLLRDIYDEGGVFVTFMDRLFTGNEQENFMLFSIFVDDAEVLELSFDEKTYELPVVTGQNERKFSYFIATEDYFYTNGNIRVLNASDEVLYERKLHDIE